VSTRACYLLCRLVKFLRATLRPFTNDILQNLQVGGWGAEGALGPPGSRRAACCLLPVATHRQPPGAHRSVLWLDTTSRVQVM
jgi:hypothetical protein